MKSMLIRLLRALALVGVFAGPAFALQPEDTIKTIAQVGSGAVSTLVADVHRIVGWQVAVTSAGGCGLYDAASVGAATNAVLFGESTAAANTSAEPVRLPYPRKITTGVTAVCVNATDVITIWYN